MSLSQTARRILEKTTPVYTATLVDESDQPITLASITTITLTLYDRQTGAIINTRTAQDIKNANQVTIHATSGLLTWSMVSADTAIQNADLPAESLEEHVALFQWVLTSGKVGKYECSFDIVQVEKVS